MKHVALALVFSFALTLVLTSTSPVRAASFYFMADVDAKIDTDSVSGKRLTLERYYRLMARLSVYALYCDFKNELGYSTRFHELWVKTEGLQAEGEETFGGMMKAYNKLERYRNEESLRYLKAGSGICRPSFPTFKRYVAMSAGQFRVTLSTAPGDL